MSQYFTNMLTGWQWVILALVPPAILTLYFLKLRRQPLEVPSTYLWSRTVEDLHVNSIWQRLRQNILLYLQLLLIALVMLACLRPGCQSTALTGNRFIFLIDASASMSAKDIEPTRLDAAKKQVIDLIEQMKSGDAAMVISFSNTAKVEQPFTDNRRLLRERVNQILPTNRTSALNEALRAAAGLANPGQTGDPDNPLDTKFAEAMPAKLYIFSDGGVAEVPNFKLGNLEPKYMKVGTEKPKNVGIVAFNVGRNPDKPEQQQAFGRVENFGAEATNVELSLYRDGELIDAQKVDLPAAEFVVVNTGDTQEKGKEKDEPNTICNPGGAGVQFDLAGLEEGLLRLEITEKDSLAVDNVAYAAINTPRRAKVLLVTPGNEALKLALGTEEAVKLAELSMAAPTILDTKEFAEQAAQGQYDLIIFDQCSPKKMPQSNTLFIGSIPPAEEKQAPVADAAEQPKPEDADADKKKADGEEIRGWSAGEVQGPPVIIDADRAHPLLALVELGNVTIAEGFPVTPPQGGSVLIDSDIGALLAIAPREGYEDAVLGFAIIKTDKDGKKQFHTDWYKRLSFPVFLKNVLEYLGGNAGAPGLPSIQPGTPMILRSQSPVQQMTVEAPNKQKVDIQRESQGNFIYSNTNELGIYGVVEGTAKAVSQRFAVNLFESRESDLHPANHITLGHETVKGEKGIQRSRKEWWKWLLIGGVLVLIFEWYVYNRRVYF